MTFLELNLRPVRAASWLGKARALKILDAIYQIGDAKYDSSDIETLKSYLAEEPKGLADYQIACSVIENEVRKLRGEIRGLQT